MDEFIALDQFKRIIKFWWLIAMMMIIGGVGGYLFHRTHPPQYDANASFFASIDSTKMPDLPIDRYQYDEDISLVVIEAILRSSAVQQATLDAARAQGMSLDAETFWRNSAIERKHAFWYIHYSSSDPVAAQSIVNIWARQGYQTMLTWQNEGRIVSYVTFAAPALAPLPDKPRIYHRNQVVLAGGMIGLVIGLFLMNIGLLPRRWDTNR